MSFYSGETIYTLTLSLQNIMFVCVFKPTAKAIWKWNYSLNIITQAVDAGNQTWNLLIYKAMVGFQIIMFRMLNQCR